MISGIKLDILFLPSHFAVFVTLHLSVLRQTLILLMFLVSFYRKNLFFILIPSLIPKTRNYMSVSVKSNWRNGIAITYFIKLYYLAVIKYGRKEAEQVQAAVCLKFIFPPHIKCYFCQCLEQCKYDKQYLYIRTSVKPVAVFV